MTRGTPAAEVRLDPELLRGLLADQHPDLAKLPIAPLGEGWDNGLFRLGASLVARLPRPAASASLVENELRWLPELAARLPLPVPAPVRVGEPGRGYPWRWSIVPWIDGEPADLAPVAAGEATRLADFLHALHQPAPASAPRNPFRGVDLRQRAEAIEARLDTLRARTAAITPAVELAWSEALAAPVAEAAGWIHGDLHAANVLVDSGSIRGVIDWGDVSCGDAATDLACLWMLFDDREVRRSALSHYDAGPALTARARGWAVAFGAILLDSGLGDHPRHAAIGAATLRRLAADT